MGSEKAPPNKTAQFKIFNKHTPLFLLDSPGPPSYPEISRTHPGTNQNQEKVRQLNASAKPTNEPQDQAENLSTGPGVSFGRSRKRMGR